MRVWNPRRCKLGISFVLRLQYNYLYLPSEMRKLLKYLFPVIMALAFWGCMDKSVPAASEEIASMSLTDTSYQTNISASESELCLPRQVSFANSNRVQSSARRTTTAHRSNLEFAKSGKVVNAGLRYIIQHQSIIVHSTLVEPTHRLLCLGKLII